jgi:hypothetical protein
LVTARPSSRCRLSRLDRQTASLQSRLPTCQTGFTRLAAATTRCRLASGLTESQVLKAMGERLARGFSKETVFLLTTGTHTRPRWAAARRPPPPPPPTTPPPRPHPAHTTCLHSLTFSFTRRTHSHSLIYSLTCTRSLSRSPVLKDFWDPVKKRRIMWVWGTLPGGLQTVPREMTYDPRTGKINYAPVSFQLLHFLGG